MKRKTIAAALGLTLGAVSVPMEGAQQDQPATAAPPFKSILNVEYN